MEMAASVSMSSTTIGEPYQLYLSSTLAQKSQDFEAIYTAYNRYFPGHATVTAQGDGIHIWDIQDLHAVASYSVEKSVRFAIPAFSLYVTGTENKSVISYALIGLAPGCSKEHRGRTIWVIRQSISSSTASASEKTAVVVDIPPVQICGTGHSKLPLMFVSKNGSLFLANEGAVMKNQLDWPGEREHLETFVFPRKLCTFVQDDAVSCSSVAITCCQTGTTLHVRLALLGEEIVPLGTCEIPMASPTSDNNITAGLTCSPTGVLSFIDSCGIWATHQLVALNSSLVWTSISEKLHLHRLTMLKSKKPRESFSLISLNTSLVLLAALVEGTQDLSLQIWDLSYGVLLATQSIPVPSGIPSAHLSLVLADQGQVLLSVSPSSMHGTSDRSSIHIIPLDTQLKSTIANALGKMAQTTKWLMPRMSKDQAPQEDEASTKIISDVRASLKKNHVQKAEQVFLGWVDSHNSRQAVLGYEFVKKTLSIILDPDLPTNYSYTPRIIRCLLENGVVSPIMVNGRLITMLRQRGDWENLMFALTKVADVSEDELMASAKFLVDRQHKNNNAMDVDASEGYVPPLWSYLFACVSYPFSATPMRLAIRKYLSDAQDLVMILEIAENWIQGGTEQEVEVLLKSLTTNTKTSSSKADSPPYPKVIAFIHALLDASFVALVQYQPSHDLLRRLLSCIEPEMALIDSLELLRGVLEPFVKVQLLREKTGASKESSLEWRNQKKRLREHASLTVGLYRLEELVL